MISRQRLPKFALLITVIGVAAVCLIFQFLLLWRDGEQFGARWIVSLSLFAIITYLVHSYARHKHLAELTAQRFETVTLNLDFSKPADLSTLAHDVVGSVTQQLGYAAGAVYQVDWPAGQIRLVHAHGFSSEFISTYRAFKIDQSPFVTALKQNRALIWKSSIDKLLNPSDKPATLAVVPFGPADQPLGILSVATVNSQNGMLHELHVLQAIGHQLGKAAQRMTPWQPPPDANASPQILLEMIRDFFFVLSEDAHIVECNACMADRMGVTPQELIGRSVLELIPLDMRSSLQQALDQLQPGAVESHRLAFVASDNTVIPVEMYLAVGWWAGQPGILGIGYDMTERQLAEASLRESDERFRQIITSNADGIIMVDEQGVVQYINPAAEKLFGLSADDLLGQTFGFPVVDDRTEIEIIRWARGDTIWAEMRVVEVVQGGVTVYLASLRDITQRKQAEAVLERRTRTLQALHDVVLDISSELDMRVLLRRVIERAVDLLNADGGLVFLYEAENDWLRIAEASQFADYIGTTLNVGEGLSGRVFQMRQPLIIDDYNAWEGHSPTYKDADLSAVMGVPLLWQDNALGVLVLFAEHQRRTFDHTDVRLAELFAAQASVAIINANLHERVQRYARMLEEEVKQQTVEIQRQQEQAAIILHNIDNAIVLMDAQGIATYVNQAFTTFLGHGVAEVVGKPLSILGEEMTDLMEKVASNQPWEKEMIIKGKDGNPHEMDVAAVPVRLPSGETESIVVSMRDIGRFKQLDRMKTSFMQHISHELRTPLSNVLIYTHLLKSGKAPQLQERHLDALDIQTRRLINLTEKVLDATRLADIEAISNWTVVQVSDLFDQAAKRFEDLAQSMGVTLAFQSPESDLPSIRGDQIWLARALGELVENAIIYTGEGGNVELSVKCEPCGPKRWIMISVHDTGVGIGEDEIARITEDLYRSDHNQSGPVPGIGLGLTITRMIIERHSGHLEVQSTEEGSTFTMHLPVHK